MQFTPSQKKALSIERHLAIVANAGSGKTRVLVQRYVDILEKKPQLSPRNVAAITFTESAAAELRTRIAKEVGDRIAASHDDRDRRRRLLAVRDSLANAFIGTIHSFASRILRAYPVEANVDASFGILTGADQRILTEEAITRMFFTELENAYANAPDGDLLKTFRKFGRRTMADLVRTLLANRSRARQVADGLLQQSDTEILQGWTNELERLVTLPIRPSTRELLDEVFSYAKKTKTAEDARSLYEAFTASTDFFARCSSFRAAKKKIVVEKTGLLNSNAFDMKLVPEALTARVAIFVEEYEGIKKLLDLFPTSGEVFEEQHREYIIYLRSIFHMNDRVSEAYEETKTSYAMLDFDDLILKLQQLLQIPQVREELSQQFAYLMIDEYQDTDENQLEIARQLSRNFGDRSNVTVVGDPKQSIYGFRNAVASIFRTTRDAIREQPLTEAALRESESLALEPQEEQGEIELAESFRMTHHPLAFINRLFTHVMQRDDEAIFRAEEVDYAPLVAGRSAAHTGSIEWICPVINKPEPTDVEQDASASEKQDEVEPEESEMIARKIRQIVNDTTGAYQVEADGVLRPAQYKDIAILLRSRTNLAILERALRAERIPYQIAKGAGFYAQQEIIDIACYLRFLITPSDDVALAGILRSPFFALSDVDLFQIAHNGIALRASRKAEKSTAGVRFWDQLVDYTQKTKKPHLVRAVEQIANNLALVGRTGSALLVEKIFAETAVYVVLGAGPNGAQKVANLDKFLASARESDASGFNSIFDFAERVMYLIEESDKDAQADLNSSGNAVQIATIHGTKGLEFPIVIIPYLQKRFNFDSQRLLDRELGLQLSFPDREQKPLISELIRLRARQNTIAEEKRIFYVALTRARDHLILSSTMNATSSPADSWLRWLQQVMPAIVAPELRELITTETITRYDGESGQHTEESAEIRIRVIRSLEDITVEEPPVTPTVPLTLGKIYLTPLPILHPKDRFSATQFLTLRQCATKYHLSYALGIPEEPKLAYDMEADVYSESVRGPMLGQIVHKLMERVDHLSVDAQTFEERFERDLDQIFFSLNVWEKKEQAQYRREARKHVSNFLTSDYASEVLGSPERKTEYVVQGQFSTGDILYGVIDRLYRSPDGLWTILDYKTDDPKINAKYSGLKRSRYQFQLGFYAYLIRKHFDNAATVRGVLFYTRTGETVEWTYDDTYFATLEKEIAIHIEEIRRNDRVKRLEDLPRNLDHCGDCNFFDTRRKECVVISASASKPTLPILTQSSVQLELDSDLL